MTNFSSEEGNKLSRKERRRIDREEQKKARYNVPNPSRRTFLKRLGIGLGAIGVASIGGLKYLESEREKSKTFKDWALEFKWENIGSVADLEGFKRSAINEYINLTGSVNLTPEQLLEPGRVKFYPSTRDFQAAVRQKKPGYTGGDVGYTDYDNSLVFFDIEGIKAEARRLPGNDGLHLARLMFHELGHLDVRLKTDGDQINNPNYYFPNTRTQEKELYFVYRGFQVYTANGNFGFNAVEEVILDVLANRLLIEKAGLPAERIGIFTIDSKYYRNGVDVLLPFSEKYIPLDELYTLHATSDFDRIVKRIGSVLPGTEGEIYKGRELFIGIQEKNSSRIAATGVNALLAR